MMMMLATTKQILSKSSRISLGSSSTTTRFRPRFLQQLSQHPSHHSQNAFWYSNYVVNGIGGRGESDNGDDDDNPASSSSSSHHRRSYSSFSNLLSSNRISTFHRGHQQPLQQQQNQNRRMYHSTSKREIIPFVIVGIGVIGFVGRYSYRALQRMDEEWEEYQWELQRYEKEHRHEFVGTNAASKYSDGTLAVDVGTFAIKLAHNGNGILVTREGSRSTFAGLVKQGSGDDDDVLVGQAAMEKYWEVNHKDPALVEMARKSSKEQQKQGSSSSLLQIIEPAIEDALERAKLDRTKMRSVITVPATSVEDVHDKYNPWNFVDDADANAWKEAEWIPEPVAAVWGAQVHGDLPLHGLKKPILVIDIGGTSTSLTVVEKDLVKTTVLMEEFGAQTFVDAICDYVVESTLQDGNDDLKTIRNDGMAWQRLRIAAQEAVQEMNTQPSVQLNIPYIGMNLETREPIHLDIRIPRQLIEQKVVDTIVTEMILKYENGSTSSILSPHVTVVPHNLSSLWMSIMTQLLTKENQLQPQDLGHVLVVGGGSKHPLMENSIKECFAFFQTNVVVPETSTRSELVALGASSILPQYEYNLDTGLIRLDDDEDDDK